MRAAVDAEDLPGDHDHDERQPWSDATGCRPAASFSRARPWVRRPGSRCQPRRRPDLPRHSATSMRNTTATVSTHVSSRGERRPVVAAHPTAPGGEHDAGERRAMRCPRTHGAGLSHPHDTGGDGLRAVAGEHRKRSGPALWSADGQGRLRDRDFRLLWGGETVSELGSRSACSPSRCWPCGRCTPHLPDGTPDGGVDGGLPHRRGCRPASGSIGSDVAGS